ncbi:AsmA family protein [Desulfosarcina ovata]|uniref:Cell envelope biogenesis protein AsmA n=1 Tax=Desulfosarcina ovata subsp. ovata TaxID=2752305 RepID=A0A5K8ADR9_9BACT|nr:AsmA family protein [Desulfosarcina ovata]BBO90638.1 cell envelope biogenesis protein AsmA [Desulfosarcina ovata subsp. ovata]
MNKVIKWILIGGLGIVGLLIVILLVVPFFVDLNTYKPLMEEKVAAATGRTFQIGSDLKLSLFPWAGVSFSDLELGNPKGFEKPAFLKIKSFEVRVKLLPLLKKDIEVQKFIASGPQVTLIKHRDGRTNWQFSTPKAAPAAPAVKQKSPASAQPTVDQPLAELPIGKLVVGDFGIDQGAIVYIDEAAGTRREVTDFNLSLKNVSFDNPVQFKTSARLDNQPVALEGSVGPVGRDIGKGTIPIDISIQAFEELNVSLAGKVTNPAQNPKIELALAVKPFSAKAVMNRLGLGNTVQTADPDVLKTLSLTANLKADQTAATVSEGKLTLDATDMDFSLNASQFDRPKIAFTLDLNQIDVDRYLPPQSTARKTTSQPTPGGEKQPSPKAGQSSTPSAQKTIDYTALRQLVLDGKMKAGKIIVNKAAISDLQLTVKAQNGVFRLDPFSLNAYQGTIAGSGLFNVKGTVPSSSIDTQIRNLQVAPLLKDQMEKDILEGTTNAEIKLKMAGDDPNRIKRTLSGEGEIRLTDGAIVGVDLPNMVRNTKAAFGLAETSGEKPRTDFTELKIPFSAAKGVITTQQTSMSSPFLRLLAAGSADLVEETVDFRIEPKLVGTMKGQGDTTQYTGLVVPVLVSGSFSDPKFRPDLKSVAQQQLEEKVFENEKVKKLFEKEEVKPYEDTVKGLLKGVLNN